MKRNAQQPVSTPMYLPSLRTPAEMYRHIREQMMDTAPERFYGTLATGQIAHLAMILKGEDLGIFDDKKLAQYRIPSGSLIMCDVYGSESNMQDAIDFYLQPSLLMHGIGDPMPLPCELIGAVTGSDPKSFSNTPDVFAQAMFWSEQHGLSPELFLDASAKIIPEEEAAPAGLGIQVVYAFRRQPRSPSAAMLIMELWLNAASQQDFMTGRVMPAMHQLGIPMPKVIPMTPLGMGVAGPNYQYLAQSA